jgi:hypothetical protein
MKLLLPRKSLFLVCSTISIGFITLWQLMAKAITQALIQYVMRLVNYQDFVSWRCNIGHPSEQMVFCDEFVSNRRFL